jgi:hypothetical protein
MLMDLTELKSYDFGKAHINRTDLLCNFVVTLIFIAVGILSEKYSK